MRRGVNLCVFLSPTSNIPCQVAEDMWNAYGSAVIRWNPPSWQTRTLSYDTVNTRWQVNVMHADAGIILWMHPANGRWRYNVHCNVISHWLGAYQLAYTQNDPCDDLAMLPTKPGDARNQVWLAAKWFMIEFQTIIHLKQQLFTNIWTRKYIHKQTTIRSSRTTNVQHWFKILKLDYYIDKQPPYYWKMKL